MNATNYAIPLEELREWLEKLSDFSLFESARDDLRTMGAMRFHMIMAEEAKPNPDKALIEQWEEEEARFRRKILNTEDRAENIRIIMECVPQIRAWYGFSTASA